MNPKELDRLYQKNKIKFHDYINNVKKNSPWDIYTIINSTLVKNPYESAFPKNFFSKDIVKYNKFILFLKNSAKYYLKNIYLFISYIVAYVIYNVNYTKQRKNDLGVIVDIFGLVDKTNNDDRFSENYLAGVYNVFENYKINYTILLRPYQVGKNPFKLIKFFNIINHDKRDFIFEYELLKLRDFFSLFILILLYPFKTLRLLQKEKNADDKVFNKSLVDDIKYFNFSSLTRYILGGNLAKINSITKIYSWSEFQVIERSFNFSIRKNNLKIELIGLQFFLNYEIYFNAYAYDIDYDMSSSAHRILVNGKYYKRKSKKVRYDVGVSLRYENIFNFKGIQREEGNLLLLGSYIEYDTKYMLESVEKFENVIFKSHPVVDVNKFGKLSRNITLSNENIYKLFTNTNFVIGTASGTLVEAVACGLSVIIIASQDNLTANPLVEYGKGKIWEIAFSKDDVKRLYNELIEYRRNNIEEIKEIASWYKDNFFIEPTEENIVKTLELEKRN